MDHGKQDKTELNLDELGIVAGGLLTSDVMNWLVNCMRMAKAEGASLEQFLAGGGDEPQTIEFCKFMWDRI